jgi:hypothetical protein
LQGKEAGVRTDLNGSDRGGGSEGDGGKGEGGDKGALGEDHVYRRKRKGDGDWMKGTGRKQGSMRGGKGC